METSFDFCERMTKMMDAYKEKVGMTLARMDAEEKPTNNDIKVWLKEMAVTQMTGMDEMACMVTEVVEEMDAMQDEVKGKDKEIRKLREKLEEQLGKGIVTKFPYNFSQNGLVAYKDGVLLEEQTLSKFLGEENLKRLINWTLRYIADLDIPIKVK